MRFMLMIKSNDTAESGKLPPKELFVAMGKYNDELVKAGVLLAVEGLTPSSDGAMLEYADGKRTVTDGPFTESKELLAGFWIIEVKSKEEAIEWAKRVPLEAGASMAEPGEVARIEIRRVGEMSDLPADAF